MRLLGRRSAAVSAICLTLAALAFSADEDLTYKHEKGRCAIRGTCKQGWFNDDLPCPDNGRAKEPDDGLREKLIDVCGDSWRDGPICCEERQVDVLKTNLERVSPMISSCPACKLNFFNLFCTFTCSPDQSLFVNVTGTEPEGDEFVVTEIDNLWSNDYSQVFFDSCKDVKFGAANQRALDLIAPGAKNYSDFLGSLGEKKFLGSPFQINFPRPEDKNFGNMEAADPTSIPCNSTDPELRCSCVDCNSSCEGLPNVKQESQCHVGAWHCLSFAVVIVYAAFLVLLVIAVAGHVAYAKHTRTKNERLRLLQDSAMSDDEDEDGDFVDQPGFLSRPPRKYFVNALCDKLFSGLGRTCASFPAVTIVTSIVIVALLSLGWLRFDIETDPVRLWVAPDSAAAEEKAFFDSHFGPFFRTEQAFLVNDTGPDGPSPVLSEDNLRWWFDVVSQVRRLKSIDGGVTLQDVCYKPLDDQCVVQSVTGYFQEDPSNVNWDTWESDVNNCADLPTTCLPEFGQPLNPKLIFGGTERFAADSKALITTWVVKNHQEGSKELERAMDWEQSLKGFMKALQGEAKHRGLRVSFNTEISLEQELNKSSNTDPNIIIVSYIIMFLYASLALGATTVTASSIFRNPSHALVQSKFMLGIVGIIIVLLSVSASVGLFSACGVKVTLIIAEVIPFLVLALGVDNIFLIVHEFERTNASHPHLPIEERMARALGRIGPSILLAAATETVAFAIGTAVAMPAVRNFAAYAAGSVVINALLQLTMFVSVLTINQRRVESRRVDCIPCIRVRRSSDQSPGHSEEDGLQRFIRNKYAPALLDNKVKVGVMTLFLGLFTAGIALLPTVNLGLDQRIAIPDDSYLISYFNDLEKYFNAGPPVYFVTRQVNATAREPQLELCGRFGACRDYSLANVLEMEHKRPEVSYIADPTANWLDDFFLWLNPELECCIEEDGRPCFADRQPPWGNSLEGMPLGAEFVHYLERWREAGIEGDCILGGKAAYADALVVLNDTLTIKASHFRTSHTPLHSEQDLIQSYAAARRVASYISDKNPGIEVFPYSKHYIFFDQYSTIVRLTVALIGCAVAASFLISSLLLGSVRTGLVVALTVIMTVTDIVGTMALANVSLNAVSLVNLVICVGIAVEFCAHIARAFQFPSARLLDRSGTAIGPLRIQSGGSNAGLGGGSGAGAPSRFRGRDARAWAALAQVGGSVFSGITITKLLGVCVLAFTRSKIFEIYYFRIWLMLVIFAALHALVFLPVALSWLGGEGYLDPDADGGIEEDLARRRYRALIPDDEYDSDDELN